MQLIAVCIVWVFCVEGSAAAPVQRHTAISTGIKFSVRLLRLVMQDSMSAVSKVWPEVRIKVIVDDKKV